MGSRQMSTMDRSFDGRKLRVLIVDDSAAVRQSLSDIIAGEPDLEVMATASDPYVAAEKIRLQVPDVILLDIEMPRMDGLTFTRKIMAQRPIPVVICSSLTEAGSDTTIKALEAGAVDVVSKPRVNTAEFLQESRMRICDVLRAAAHARVSHRQRKIAAVRVEEKLTADVILPPVRPERAAAHVTDSIICIGASTGGTEALRDILVALPPEAPGIVVVQHMPEKFTAAFARRLDGLCAMSVKEAADGDLVSPGTVLIAPGNFHTLLERVGRQYRAAIKQGPAVSRHRPSVDVLFRSAAQCAGSNALGILLTGMGDDGARGLLEMKNAGARTIAQSEESCIVFGMPKEAIQRGAADKVLSLNRIAFEIMQEARRRKVSA
jgi:two-component system, chemotaxis family, protein-glutamate methylesterase/glutaminase